MIVETLCPGAQPRGAAQGDGEEGEGPAQVRLPEGQQVHHGLGAGGQVTNHSAAAGHVTTCSPPIGWQGPLPGPGVHGVRHDAGAGLQDVRQQDGEVHAQKGGDCNQQS